MEIIKVHGNVIQGTILGVKRLVNSQDYFFTKYESSLYVDDYDTMGIQVQDILTNLENKKHFDDKDGELVDIVKDILFDNNYEVAIKPVRTNPIPANNNNAIDLRLKHVNSDFSKKYKDAIGINKTLVFGAGLYGNLNTFEDDGYAKKAVEQGFDTWLIEITGGENIECENCYNYYYSDTAEYFWPALIAGVEQYSGAINLNYVGHSNGCRSALTSLNLYSQTGKESSGKYFDYEIGQWQTMDLSQEPIDTFIGIGCPVNLNAESFTGNQVRDINEDTGELRGDFAIRILTERNDCHVSRWDYGILVAPVLGNILSNDYDISLNLQSFYNYLYTNQSSTEDFSDMKVNRFYQVASTWDDDFTLPKEDVFYLRDEVVNVNEKDIIWKSLSHGGLRTNSNTQEEILEKLKE